MNTANEERLKIAVFIDFDNIAIGVKQSLGRNFDVGTVLEAIKEKGEVITKIAYGDWKRAEDFSRAMTQHAVQMVQRNLTPGGDKNGADIALALEGGYDTDVLARGVHGTLASLMGTESEDPLGRPREPETDVNSLIDAIARKHHLE